MIMERSWKWRRLLVFIIVLACLVMLAVALRIGGNDLVNLKIIDGAFWLIALVAGAYLGIAEWSDRNKAKEVLNGIADKIKPPGDQ